MSKSWNGITYSYTGVRIDLRAPDLSKLTLDDFIVPLSRIYRYSGNTLKPYSVARHSVLVSELCSFDKELSKFALLHDFQEALIGDITRPVKDLFAKDKFAKFDSGLSDLIMLKFTGSAPSGYSHSIVKHYDDMALMLEGRRIHPNPEWVKTDEIRTIDLNLEDYSTDHDLFLINQRFEQLFGKEHQWR